MNGQLSNTYPNILDKLNNVHRSGDTHRAACPICERDKHRRNDSALVIFDSGHCYCHRCGAKTVDILRALSGVSPSPLPRPQLRREHPQDNSGRCECGNAPYKPKRTIEATYDYRDELGVLAFQKVRFVHHEKNGGRGPKFIVRHRHGDQWFWGAGASGTKQPPLYNAQRLIAAADVFICEGEKDADTLIKLGLNATTDYAGAWKNAQRPKWKADAYVPLLTLRNIYILPDNDAPGETRAAFIAASLARSASTVCIVRLPGIEQLGEGADVTDWINNGGRVETLREVARRTPPFNAAAVDLFTTSGAVSRPAAAGVSQWINGGAHVSRSAPSCECGKCGNRPIVTFYEDSARVSRMRTATWRECEKERHRETLRWCDQIAQEQRRGNIYLGQVVTGEYDQWATAQRQRRKREGAEAARWRALHLTDSTTALFSTDAASGELLPPAGDELYDIVFSLLSLADETRRNRGSNGWGRAYAYSRGNGQKRKRKNAAAATAAGEGETGENWTCSQYIVGNMNTRKVCTILGAEYRSERETVHVDGYCYDNYQKLINAGAALKLRSVHVDIHAVALGETPAPAAADGEGENVTVKGHSTQSSAMSAKRDSAQLEFSVTMPRKSAEIAPAGVLIPI